MAELHYRSAEWGWFYYHLSLLAEPPLEAVAAVPQHAPLVPGAACLAYPAAVVDQVQMQGEIPVLRHDPLQGGLRLLRPDAVL